MEGFYIYILQYGNHMSLLGTWNMTITTEKVNLYFNFNKQILNSHKWLVATILDDMKFSNTQPEIKCLGYKSTCIFNFTNIDKCFPTCV